MNDDKSLRQLFFIMVTTCIRTLILLVAITIKIILPIVMIVYAVMDDPKTELDIMVLVYFLACITTNRVIAACKEKLKNRMKK